MSGQHAPLAPSSAPQWGNCSASIPLGYQIPDVEHPRTRGGTASHWVAADALEKYRDEALAVAVCSDYVGTTAPNGVVIDDEMAEGAQIFVDHCLSIVQRHGHTSRMLIEHRVKMPTIHPQNWGTLDFSLVEFGEEWVDHGTPHASRAKIVTIHLSDYKFGHREVKARGNLQMIDYLEGLIEEYEIDGYEDQRVRFVISIVHPFAYHADGPVDTWEGTLAELRAYFNQLHQKAHEVFTNPQCTTGPWCRDCKAIVRCEAARQADYSLIDYIDRPMALDNMTSSELGTEYLMLERGAETLNARREALQEQIRYKVSQGDTGSGLSLAGSFGRLGWKAPAAVVVSLCRQFGFDGSKPGAITPTQAVAKVDPELKPHFEKAIKNLTEKPARGTKLIKRADSPTAAAFPIKK